MTGGTGTFAELLRRHRVKAGLSRHELTRRRGLGERALRDLERGRGQPRSHSAPLLADALSPTGEDRGVFLAATRAEAVNAATVAAPAEDLIGRHDEPAALLDLVAGARHRLIAVTGPAGFGRPDRRSTRRRWSEGVAPAGRCPAGASTQDLRRAVSRSRPLPIP